MILQYPQASLYVLLSRVIRKQSRHLVRVKSNAIHNQSSSPNSVCTTHSTHSSDLGLGDLGFFSDDDADDADTPISLPSPPPKRQRLSFDKWLASQEENL